MSLQPSVSFITLALNEENYIESTVNEIITAVKSSNLRDYQIVLVDDGSVDKTPSIMDKMASENSKITVVHNKTNLGPGGAFRVGARVATGDYIMTIAGDDSMPACDVLTIINCVGKADIVLPYLTNYKLRPLGRRIGSKGFTILINLLFGLNIRYYQGQLPRRALFEKIELKDESYAFAAEVVVKLIRMGATYVEVPVGNTPSKQENSRALQPQRIVKVLKAIFGLIKEIRQFKGKM